LIKKKNNGRCSPIWPASGEKYKIGHFFLKKKLIKNTPETQPMPPPQFLFF
jgi:hypothetical protein